MAVFEPYDSLSLAEDFRIRAVCEFDRRCRSHDLTQECEDNVLHDTVAQEHYGLNLMKRRREGERGRGIIGQREDQEVQEVQEELMAHVRQSPPGDP